MALAIKTVLKGFLNNFLKSFMTAKLTVTICLRGVSKKQRLAPTLRHFLLSVTINLHLPLAYVGAIAPNAM